MIRLFIGVIGVLTLAISLLLFLQPLLMIRIWPWMLTPLTARVVGAMFALLGVLGLCIALEPRWSAARLLLEAHACSIAMILIAAAVRLQVRQPQGSAALVSAALNHCNKWVHHEPMEVTLAP